MSIKVLATGDLHIGRRSSKIPTAFSDPEEFSCASMWMRLVDCALEEEVDLVLLSGDLVEQDNCFFEAIAPLERGLEKLRSHGIQTYATAGNHDARVLPQLTKLVQSGSLHLLGEKAAWQSIDCLKDNEPLVRIHGWSFHHHHHQTSPMLHYNLEPHPDVPTLGLLHADLDVPNSNYAPVSLDDLQSQDVAIWVLGHQHKPRHEQRAGRPQVLYPGSPQAMDPGEGGPHGPWILQLEGKNTVTAKQLPLSTVRYDTCRVNAEDCAEAEQLRALLFQKAEDFETDLQTLQKPPRLALLRFIIEGRSAFSSQLHSLPELEPGSGIYSQPLLRREIAVYAEKIKDETQPVFDLEELAEKKDPVGIVAALLLELETGAPDSETKALIERSLKATQDVDQSSSYVRIRGEGPQIDREAATAILRAQGLLLLTELRKQEIDP